MPNYSELEIGLSHRDAESYIVELRFTQPDSDTDNAYERGVARFDTTKLRSLAFKWQSYGKALAAMLFEDSRLLSKFENFCVAAFTEDGKLRLRLFIDRSAPELHSLRWETLFDPREDHRDSWLIADERIVFSRYLRSSDWRPVKLKSKGELSALVAVANPSDVDSYGLGAALTQEQVAGELSRVRESLGAIKPSELVSDAVNTGQVSLNQIIARLHEGVDILYLMCHGKFGSDELGNRIPNLWLEQPDGTSKVESGIELVERLRRLSIQPRLIVLASCQSAGGGETTDRTAEDASDKDDDKGALAALGPRLAEAGIPVVVAMQGNVSQKTITEFMPIFFQELSKQGQLDLAIATARSVVSNNGDAWMPVLYSRLRSARFWYERGFRVGDQKAEFEKWDSLVTRIKEGKCTPILGYGLLESVLGSKREIAQRWADDYHFPMAPCGKDDLPQVAQYLISAQDESFPREELGRYLVHRLSERYGFSIDSKRAPIEQLDDLLVQVIRARQAQDPAEPHSILAKLPFKVYITTNPDNLLTTSLSDVGKTPDEEVCPWNRYLDEAPPEYDKTPTDKAPLVFYLFGQLKEEDTLVLTEDDYFDYLIGVTSTRELIPEVVLGKQSRTQLLFLGFQLDDWNFRVLLKSLMRPGSRASRGYEHVAVQIDPDEDRLLDATRAKQILEKYFGNNKISIYWGSAEDFLQELRSKWNDRYGKEIPL